MKKAKEAKEKGQGRRERRAKSAAEAEAGQSKQADDGNDASSAGTVGAYVHISRISDERVEHVERLYKPGQKVMQDRAVGARNFGTVVGLRTQVTCRRRIFIEIVPACEHHEIMRAHSEPSRVSRTKHSL